MTKPRIVVLRTAHHELVAAFECHMVELFIAGPGRSAPDVVFYGSRVFVFTTMSSEYVTYSEAFSFSLVEGATARHLPPDELDGIPPVEPASGSSPVNVVRNPAIVEIEETMPNHDAR